MSVRSAQASKSLLYTTFQDPNDFGDLWRDTTNLHIQKTVVDHLVPPSKASQPRTGVLPSVAGSLESRRGRGITGGDHEEGPNPTSEGVSPGRSARMVHQAGPRGLVLRTSAAQLSERFPEARTDPLCARAGSRDIPAPGCHYAIPKGTPGPSTTKRSIPKCIPVD